MFVFVFVCHFFRCCCWSSSCSLLSLFPSRSNTHCSIGFDVVVLLTCVRRWRASVFRCSYMFSTPLSLCIYNYLYGPFPYSFSRNFSLVLSAPLVRFFCSCFVVFLIYYYCACLLVFASFRFCVSLSPFIPPPYDLFFTYFAFSWLSIDKKESRKKVKHTVALLAWCVFCVLCVCVCVCVSFSLCFLPLFCAVFPLSPVN